MSENPYESPSDALTQHAQRKSSKWLVPIGLCLVLAGFTLIFFLPPAIDAAGEDAMRQMDRMERADEALRLRAIQNWTVRVGVISAIAGGLLLFSAWIAGSTRRHRLITRDGQIATISE